MPRWVIFNSVGTIGFGVQLAVLGVLLRLDLHYLAATAIAVEAAVLHNFMWHERWTWRDRRATGAVTARRLLRFHALNGLISVAGNMVVMAVLVETMHMPPAPANVAAVIICALLNFMASERLVFIR